MMHMEPEDFEKNIEELKANSGGQRTFSIAGTDDDVDFEFVRDDQGREYAIPKKNFIARRQQVWERIHGRHHGLPALMGMVRFSDFQKGIYDSLCQGGKNAILFGPAGTGKTQVALAGLHNLCMGARSVVAMRFSEIKRRMEPRQLDADKPTPMAVLHSMTEAEYLLIDEVGYGQAERRFPSEHERQILFELISERDAFDKHTWLTTNMNLETLEEFYGDAAISRLGKWGSCVKADFTKQPNYRYRKAE